MDCPSGSPSRSAQRLQAGRRAREATNLSILHTGNAGKQLPCIGPKANASSARVRLPCASTGGSPAGTSDPVSPAGRASACKRMWDTPCTGQVTRSYETRRGLQNASPCAGMAGQATSGTARARRLQAAAIKNDTNSNTAVYVAVGRAALLWCQSVERFTCLYLVVRRHQ